jgi:CheY-like chemotaxis protein
VDPGQLEQSLVNLVSNARDAMPSGGTCTIIIERITDTSGAPRVRLHVEDEGVGMSDEIATRAFEPFFTTKPRGQGTGLGLASVHGMAEQSDGSAQITSRAGHGTRVTIDLPWVEAAASRIPDTEVPSPSRSGPQSILVAEDDSGTRRVVQRILEHAGYIVQTADDGTEAMALIENAAVSFDMVLSDVMMPGHTGPEIMDRVRARRPGTPVLLMTGYAEEQLSELLAAGPGREIITKPFSTESLLARVAALLNATATARAER